MNNTQTFKRKKLFVQPAFQGRFILWGMVAVLLASVLSASLLYFLLTAFYEAQNQSAHIILTQSWQRLGLAILLANCIALFVGLLLVSFIVLYRSHKIAGPLYRFCRVFEKIGEGDLDEMIQLRKNDELASVADSIQFMIEQLQKQRLERQQLVQAALEQIESNSSGAIDSQTIQSVKQILIQLQSLEEKNQ